MRYAATKQAVAEGGAVEQQLKEGELCFWGEHNMRGKCVNIGWKRNPQRKKKKMDKRMAK